jgi:hypothetical protein
MGYFFFLSLLSLYMPIYSIKLYIMDRTTLFAVIDMITTRLSDIKEEQKDSLIAYSDKELFSVKLELRDVLKKLWAEVNKLDDTSDTSDYHLGA